MYIFTIILNDANGILDIVAIGSSNLVLRIKSLNRYMFNEGLHL